MLTLAGKTLAVPVLQGGMGVGVSLGGLAGAVAACGGMGCISTADTGYREPDFARDPYAANLRALKKEIAKAKEIANGAGLVAINAMVATQNYADAVRTAVEAYLLHIINDADRKFNGKSAAKRFFLSVWHGNCRFCLPVCVHIL